MRPGAQGGYNTPSNWSAVIQLWNDGDRPCLIPALLSVTAVFKDGNTIPAQYDRDLYPAELSVGIAPRGDTYLTGYAAVVLAAPETCTVSPTPKVITALIFDLGHGDKITKQLTKAYIGRVCGPIEVSGTHFVPSGVNFWAGNPGAPVQPVNAG